MKFCSKYAHLCSLRSVGNSMQRSLMSHPKWWAGRTRALIDSCHANSNCNLHQPTQLRHLKEAPVIAA